MSKLLILDLVMLKLYMKNNLMKKSSEGKGTKSNRGLHCKVCSFTLTGGKSKMGDICPWCGRGYLELPINHPTHR